MAMIMLSPCLGLIVATFDKDRCGPCVVDHMLEKRLPYAMRAVALNLEPLALDVRS